MTMKLSDKVYTALCMLFVSFIIVGNLTCRKVVVLNIPFLRNFEIDVGVMLFPISFLLTDLITEFFGKDRVKCCVRLAVVINIIVASIVMFMKHMHAASWSEVDDITFCMVFGFYHVVVVGSMIACYIAQMIDVFVYLCIRAVTKEKFLWLRSSISSAISLLVDTLIMVFFVIISGMQPFEKCWELIRNSYSWKLFFIICNVALFYIFVGIIRMILRRTKWMFIQDYHEDRYICRRNSRDAWCLS